LRLSGRKCSQKHLTRTPHESAQNIEDADLEVAKIIGIFKSLLQS
jgi:hypothetical protein